MTSVISLFTHATDPIIPIQDVTKERLATAPDRRSNSSTQKNTPINLNSDILRKGLQTLNNPQLTSVINGQESFKNTPPINTTSISLREMVTNKYKPTQNYSLKPKDNILVPVGRGLMNSISTNFNMLAVRTSDEKSLLEIDSGYLYATINGDDPVGLILFEDGVLESQVSIVLVPIDAPPSMIDLDIELTKSMLSKANAHKEKLAKEEAQELAKETKVSAPRQTNHTKRIVNLLTPVARGNLPSGFTLTNDTPNHMIQPCQVTINQVAGQRLTGGREVIDVVLMTNDSQHPYRVREEMCLSRDTLAVALFEKSYLLPGEQTEVYILRDKFFQQNKQRSLRRPRLTGGKR